MSISGPVKERLQTNAGKHKDISISEAVIILDDIINDWSGEKGALIPVLQSAQNLLGYLPEEILVHISEKLVIPLSEVTGVVSFYSWFSTVPKGRHVVRVCLGTACYVRGGKDVLASMKKTLGIEIGEITQDGCFSLEVGRCFGACGLAPVVMIDGKTYQRVKPSKLKDLLNSFLAEEKKEFDNEK